MPVISSNKESVPAKEDQDPDAQDAQEPLMGSSDSLVQHLSPDPFAVDAERVEGEATGGELMAQAVLPCEFAATLSDNFQPGQSFMVQGPLGPIKVDPPEDAKPGMTLRYRLAPKPDFRVQVPPGGKPGSLVTFQRSDGVEINVAVPEGHVPGDTFDVTPPSLMVRVPDGAEKGDYITFFYPTAPNMKPDRFRAQVPEGLQAGGFMTARLPLPKPQKSPSGPEKRGQGIGAVWKAFRQEVGYELKDSLQLLRGLKHDKEVAKAAE